MVLMGSGLVKSIGNLATFGALNQYSAQKEAMKAQQQSQLMANMIQQQALEQQKASAEQQRLLQERELVNQAQTNEMNTKYTVSNNRQNEMDKNSADLTKGLGGGALPVTKKTLSTEDEEFNQWY